MLTEPTKLQEMVMMLLAAAPATSAELARKLGTPEESVLAALESLRAERLVQHVAGAWSLTDKYQEKPR